jgi:hypothetical protein
MESEKFESWAIIEIFGHTQIAGKVTEASIVGCSFIRVDVPECDGQPAFTKFYGQGAIYSMTPCGEQVARAALAQIRPAPISVYIPSLDKILNPQRRLPMDYGENEGDD